MIEAQERHEKSPKKKTSHTGRCGSSGGILIYILFKCKYFLFVYKYFCSFLPHLRLPVLHGELDGDLEPLPVAGGLHDVLSDLLGGETEWSHLGGEGAGGAHLAAHHAELDDLDLVRVKLGRHAEAEAEVALDLKRGTVFRKQKTTFNHEGPKT